MPGIAGIIQKTASPAQPSAIERMVSVMVHEDFYTSGSFSLGNGSIALGWVSHRGSFSDCLPVWNETKDVCLIFAGEDFTDAADINLLQSRGHRCRMDVADYLVHLYEEKGIAFLEQLNGWFSGLLVDLRIKKTYLFNDRYGLHRIYYHETPDAFLFASEAKALLEVKPELRRLDPQGLGEWLSCGCVLQNRTLFPGIFALSGGSVWAFAPDGTVSKQKYFDPEDWKNQTHLAEAEYYDQLRETFPRILKRYFRAGPRLGMSLTGGLDGRMVMAWAGRHAGELPCYTFNGPFRDCADVELARHVAVACHQPHQTIPVGADFLAQFPRLAERTVRITDGMMDVSGAAELFVNRLARGIAPVRLTGNYGSEILRNNVAFRAGMISDELFEPAIAAHAREAARTYATEVQGNYRGFITFKQVPWHHFTRFTLEQSQITMRSPFLDNELVALAFQSPATCDTSLIPSLRLIVDGNAALGKIPTDRGVTYPASRRLNKLRRAWADLMARAECAYDYGMPQWLAKVDHVLSPLKLERIFCGRQKFLHYRVWYRRELAGFVRDVLLDSQSLSRPYLNRQKVQAAVAGHLDGTANHTLEIHKLLSLELLHRTLLERN